MPYSNSFRSFWATGGYRTDFGSAATGKPPSREFIRLYHLASAKHAISDVQYGRLKVARFEDLNDPFEARALELRNKMVRAVVKNFGKELGRTTGLICFSEDWTSPVLWSHYANGHCGICLGFDVRRTAVRKLQYRSKRLLAELTDTDDPFTLSAELQRELARTKCREWAYERERRMLVSLESATEAGGLLFRPFDDKLCLKEVILGMKCGLDIDDVRHEAARYSGVNTFKSRLAWGHFKIVPLESSVP